MGRFCEIRKPLQLECLRLSNDFLSPWLFELWRIYCIYCFFGLLLQLESLLVFQIHTLGSSSAFLVSLYLSLRFVDQKDGSNVLSTEKLIETEDLRVTLEEVNSSEESTIGDGSFDHKDNSIGNKAFCFSLEA